MTRGRTTGGSRPSRSRTARPTTGTCSTTTPTRARPPLAPPARRRARALPPRPGGVRLEGRRLDRSPARRLRPLRAPRRDVHARRHPRLRDRAARPPPRHRGRPRRGDAGQRLQRHPQLGLRRRRVVRGARAVRRPGRVPPVRRRLSCRGPRRRPGRRAQPPRPSGNYLPLLRSLPQGRPQHLGRPGQPRRRRVAGGAPLRLDNVRMWFEDYHVDALRLDACTLSATPPRCTCSRRWRSRSRRSRPTCAVRSRSSPSRTSTTPRSCDPREAGGHGLDAQWSDDFHHAVHVALSGETTGYYADFEPLEALAKVWREGLLPRRHFSSFRGRDHGAPVDTATMPTWRLVVANQNHDQVGNRARGDRLAEHLDDDQLACAALLTLAGPFTPMLFMGEEWAASSPFAFFTSHPEPELGTATAEGRIAEFEKMGWDPDDVLDPQDPRRSTAHGSTGTSWRPDATPSCSTATAASAPAARAAAAHRPVLRSRQQHRRRSAVDPAPRRPGRAGQRR